MSSIADEINFVNKTLGLPAGEISEEFMKGSANSPSAHQIEEAKKALQATNDNLSSILGVTSVVVQTLGMDGPQEIHEATTTAEIVKPEVIAQSSSHIDILTSFKALPMKEKVSTLKILLDNLQ